MQPVHDTLTKSLINSVVFYALCSSCPTDFFFFFYIMLFPSEVRFYGFENRSNTIDERICCSFCLTFQPAYTCLPLCLQLLGIDYNYMSKFPTSCCESYFVWDFYEHHIIIFFLGKVKKIRNRIFTFETYWSLIDFFFLSSCQRLMKAGIGSWFVTVFSKINFVFLVDISFLSEFGRVQVRLSLGTNICKTAKSQSPNNNYRDGN